MTEVTGTGINSAGPSNMLEVADNTFNLAQLRLDNSLTMPALVDFLCSDAGNLIIHPVGGLNSLRVGIGGAFDETHEPIAKLDVLSPNLSQLRLTYTYNSVFTDFTTDASGFLIINPTGDNVGIGTSASSPKRTLDVFGRARIQSLPSSSNVTDVVVADDHCLE
ncbi:MAG: hypothetical protein LH473_07515 [Chitinophagales bacterium]|nr:hypothetical protein [Chitinophagales bacterium]